MANPEHLAKLAEGVEVWNEWRKPLRYIELDLSEAPLAEKELGGVNLSRTNLENADLSKARLMGAKLVAARLGGAQLNRANLFRAAVSSADLSRSDCSGSDFIWANLSNAIFSDSNLSSTSLYQADLRGADLRRSDLSGADLRSANLQGAVLDGAVLNEARLWETQRAGWSVKGVICECAFWDEDAKKPIAYSVGEFERLYSEQTCIELFYQGGVSTFELNTLPALLQHLASIHQGSNIRLKSIEETGGGARISISVGDADTETAEKIKADAMRVYQAQLVLREKEAERLQIEKSYLESLFLGRLIPSMLSAGAPQNVFNAPVTGLVLASGDAKVDFHQTVNDNPALIALLERMIDRRTDLQLSVPEEMRLETELKSAKSELQKSSPDSSALKKSTQLIQKLATEALTHAASKLGEAAISADWPGWLHELGRFVSGLR